jgi:transposase-like protein
MDIVKTAKRNSNTSKTARFFGVCPKSLRNWKKNYHQLQEKALKNPNARTVSTDPFLEYPELEENLNEWCLGMLMDGIGFKTDKILNQAL